MITFIIRICQALSCRSIPRSFKRPHPGLLSKWTGRAINNLWSEKTNPVPHASKKGSISRRLSSASTMLPTRRSSHRSSPPRNVNAFMLIIGVGSGARRSISPRIDTAAAVPATGCGECSFARERNSSSSWPMTRGSRPHKCSWENG